MKLHRVGCWLAAAIVTLGTLNAQTPEQLLRAAVDQLLGAGNYSWEEKRTIELDPGGRPARGTSLRSGETSIGGYTAAISQRRRLVFLGRKAAYQVKTGWRHCDDLTEEEIRELWPYGGTNAPIDLRARDYTRPLAHELLQLFLQMGRNIRKDGAVITGDLGTTSAEYFALERHVAFGLPLSDRAASSILGLPRPKAATRPVVRGAGRGMSATFLVWLDGSELTELAVEFKLSTATSEPRVSTSIYSTKLTKVGATTLEVEPEAKALFLGGR